MRVSKSIAMGLAILLSPALPARAQEPSAPAETRKITITARKYEFTPSRIELKVGETVEITLEAEDTTHGFTCKELGIEKVVFEKGKPETIRIKPEKTGAYEFKCAKFCGFGHTKMKGEIVVAAAETPAN
jgi:cytochrome c oxidase subunit II